VSELLAYLQSLFAETGIVLPIAVTLLAGLMRGFAGFGSAMLMAPIFAILFGPAQMVVTIVAIELAISLHLFPQVRPDVDWPTVVPMSIAACIAMPFGVWLLASVDKNAIVAGVSAIIVAFVLVSLAGWRYRGRKGRAGAIAVGALSGAMMATTSVGGPPVLMYLFAGDDKPATIRANIVTYYFLTSFLLIAIVLGLGAAGWGPLVRAVVLLPVMLVGSWVGTRLFDPREKLYRTLTLLILLGTGLFGLLRTLVVPG
jgi:uncharacterized membrane protein YfcA